MRERGGGGKQEILKTCTYERASVTWLKPAEKMLRACPQVLLLLLGVLFLLNTNAALAIQVQAHLKLEP